MCSQHLHVTEELKYLHSPQNMKILSSKITWKPENQSESLHIQPVDTALEIPLPDI